MNEEFLNKVYDQIISETRVIDNKIHAPFFSPSPLLSPFSLSSLLLFISSSFYSHCRDVYCLNKEETKYVWREYKKELTDIINEKELIHQEKG